MKKFTASVQYVTITRDPTVIGIDETPVVVYGADRNDAIRKACDIGQAIARSTNHSEINVFFRIVDITEIGA